MLFDVQVGFSLKREKKKGEEQLTFLCNHCDEIILSSPFNHTRLLDSETYRGIEGYLQLHLMECQKYKQSLYKEKYTTTPTTETKPKEEKKNKEPQKVMILGYCVSEQQDNGEVK